MDCGASEVTRFGDSWMDASLFHQPCVEVMAEFMEDTEVPKSSSYYVCLESNEMVKVDLPLTAAPPCLPPTPPPSLPPASPPVTVTSPQSSPKSSSTESPLQAKKRKQGKTTKAKPAPKYTINPEDCSSEAEKNSVRSAIKCKRNRTRKEQEKEMLVQNNIQLENQIQVLTEQIREELVKSEELQREVDRRGHVILAMSVSGYL